NHILSAEKGLLTAEGAEVRRGKTEDPHREAEKGNDSSRKKQGAGGRSVDGAGSRIVLHEARRSLGDFKLTERRPLDMAARLAALLEILLVVLFGAVELAGWLDQRHDRTAKLAALAQSLLRGFGRGLLL